MLKTELQQHINKIVDLLKVLDATEFYAGPHGMRIDVTADSSRIELVGPSGPIIEHGADLTTVFKTVREKLVLQVLKIRDENKERYEVADKALQQYK